MSGAVLPIRLGTIGTIAALALAVEIAPVAAAHDLVALTGDPAIAPRLIALYAATAAVLALPVVYLSRRLPRAGVLAAALVVVAASQCVMAVSESTVWLIVARCAAASTHGILWSLTPVLAAGLVARDRQGRAAGSVFIGASLAGVGAAPALALLAEAAGWNAVCLLLGLLALVLAGLTAVLLGPGAAHRDRRGGTVGTSAGSGDEGGAEHMAAAGPHETRRLVGAICVGTVLLVGAHFAGYAELPRIAGGFGIVGDDWAFLLTLFGASGLVGVMAASRAVDRRPIGTATAMAVLMIAGFILLTAATISGGAALLWLAVPVWAAGYAAVPPVMQTAVLRYVPDDADRATAAYVVAFQIGIAVGAALGAVFGAHGPVMVAITALIGAAAGATLLPRIALPRTRGGEGLRPRCRAS